MKLSITVAVHMIAARADSSIITNIIGTGYPETFYVAWRMVTRLIWKFPFRTHCNLLHTINNCYPIEFILEKRCIKFPHSCLSSDNLVINNVA